MKLISIILLILFLPICYADWNTNSESLVLEVDISNDVEIITDSKSNIEYLEINQSFYPESDHRQDLILRTVLPTPLKINDETSTIEFRWNKPTNNILSYSILSQIKTKNIQQKVKNKVTFPVTNLPEDILKYTQPSITIDSDNSNIVKIANEISQGNDDLFFVINDFSKWIKSNINYSLSSLTSQASQKATWVLENRYGVCDEISTLFIAFCRAVGIPARFISGISYTDSTLFTDNWGNHGWAEVYYPDVGWVDYDITYGQIGYLDPTHIKLKTSIDPSETSTKYQWFGNGINLKTKQTLIETSLIEKIGTIKPDLSIEIYPIYRHITPDSSNIIATKIKNLNNYYISEELYLYGTQETFIDEERRFIALRPLEEKTIYWKIDLKNLKKNYIYTFPIGIKTSKNITSETEFKTSSMGKKILESDIDSYREIAYKKLVNDFDINCTKEIFYSYEDIVLDCTVKNTGNSPIDINLCLNECVSTDLGISKMSNLLLPVSVNNSQKLKINAKANYKAKDYYYDLVILETPNLDLINIEYSPEIKFKDDLKIGFDVINSEDLNFSVYAGNSDLKIDAKNNSITINYLLLNEGKNTISLFLEYKDKKEKGYLLQKEIDVTLKNMNIFQKITYTLKRVFKKNI